MRREGADDPLDSGGGRREVAAAAFQVQPDGDDLVPGHRLENHRHAAGPELGDGGLLGDEPRRCEQGRGDERGRARHGTASPASSASGVRLRPARAAGAISTPVTWGFPMR